MSRLPRLCTENFRAAWLMIVNQVPTLRVKQPATWLAGALE